VSSNTTSSGRRGGLSGSSTRARVIGASLVMLAALTVFVLVWFQPQKLLVDQRVDEGLPQGVQEEEARPASEGASAREPQAGPRAIGAGRFRSLEHDTTGRALVLALADGSRYLRFDDLATSNGPELRVYLSEVPAGDDWYAYGERFVDLGALKGNVGDQNYELPDDIDLARYKSAVIWCRRFSVGFGVAPLDRGA
jgi:hypothetical protein